MCVLIITGCNIVEIWNMRLSSKMGRWAAGIGLVKCHAPDSFGFCSLSLFSFISYDETEANNSVSQFLCRWWSLICTFFPFSHPKIDFFLSGLETVFAVDLSGSFNILTILIPGRRISSNVRHWCNSQQLGEISPCRELCPEGLQGQQLLCQTKLTESTAGIFWIFTRYYIVLASKKQSLKRMVK